MFCMSELLRRHPINKAGAARAKQGSFLMLTMAYILVRKGVIHSVTVMKKFYVCCFWDQRQCHLGVWPPGRPGRVSAGYQQGPSGARAALGWASLASEWKGGYSHTPPHRAAISTSSTSYCLQILSILSVRIQLTPSVASPWSPAQSTARPMLIRGSADFRSGLLEAHDGP